MLSLMQIVKFFLYHKSYNQWWNDNCSLSRQPLQLALSSWWTFLEGQSYSPHAEVSCKYLYVCLTTNQWDVRVQVVQACINWETNVVCDVDPMNNNFDKRYERKNDLGNWRENRVPKIRTRWRESQNNSDFQRENKFWI